MGRALAIVVNANASRGAIMGRPLSRLRATLRPDERLFVSHSDLDMAQIAAEITRIGLPPVALLGGDGTLTRSLTALATASGGALPPRLLLLRGGTMNTVADGMGLPAGAPHALLARYRRGGTGRRVCTLSADRRIGFLFSTGLMHDFLRAYYDSPLGTGVVGAATLLTRAVGSAALRGPLAQRLSAGVEAALEVDGALHPRRRYLFIGAGTVPQVGLAFRPYARAGRGTPGFHLLGYRGHIGALAGALPHFARGHAARVPNTMDCLARSLRIDAGGTGVPYALDGELHDAVDPLCVELGPTLDVYP